MDSGSLLLVLKIGSYIYTHTLGGFVGVLNYGNRNICSNLLCSASTPVYRPVVLLVNS